MDVDLRWGGDPNIVLGVTALIASIPIQVTREIFKYFSFGLSFVPNRD